jgi:glycosyltransferase involved in cell wall biosynthesis
VSRAAPGRVTLRLRAAGRQRRTALWASTSLETRGGVSSFVRSMSATPLWDEWNVRHVATHRDGTTPAKIAQFVVSLPKFVCYLVFDRPDVVHLQVASYGSFFRKFTLSVIATAFGVPVVTHIHGGQFHVFYANSPKIVQKAVGHSSAVIALGNTWAKRLTAIQPSAEVLVVPNPARPVEAVDQPKDCEPVGVLFLGRVEEQKGAFCLIDAWHQMVVDHEGGRPARLTIVGDGDVERAHTLVRELGLHDKVNITGWVTPVEVQGILRSSQVLVLPSHIEGQPMAILESMANGLCVIASPVGGIPDLIDDSCGILVPPGDVARLASALGGVVQDEQTRVRLGTAALQRVRDEFDVDVIWRRFDRVYREVSR